MNLKRSENIKRYKEFYEKHQDIPVFCSPWWLDVVAPGQWDVILIERNNQIVCSFPFYYHKKFGVLRLITEPKLTQKMGPYIVYSNRAQSDSKKIKFENELYQEIIDLIPKFDYFSMAFDQKYRNWLGFYWNGFHQTTRYSYRISNLNDENLLSRFSQTKRQLVKKAINKYKFCTDMTPEEYYTYYNDAVTNRGEKMYYEKDIIIKLCQSAIGNNMGKIFSCKDEQGNVLAVNFTVWDKECAYYIGAMRKKEYNQTGGTEFLIYNTMKYVSRYVDCFDFEGSMTPGVEETYRSFGTSQTEFYQITRVPNSLLRGVLSFWGEQYTV